LPEGKSICISFFIAGAEEMRSKDVLGFLTSFLIVSIVQSSSAKEAAGKYHFTIVYTNDVQGEVEPCG
jgi:hypothetical protein